MWKLAISFYHNDMITRNSLTKVHIEYLLKFRLSYDYVTYVKKVFVQTNHTYWSPSIQQWTIGPINGEIVPFLVEIVHPT